MTGQAAQGAIVVDKVTRAELIAIASLVITLSALIFNIGTGGFCRSTAARRFNAGNWRGGCDAFLMWNKAGGREVRGLTLRRQRERALCLKGL